jgi:hypothetical protein
MAITANTKILTLDYWKPASQLEVGDYVFDHKGQIVKVTLAQQYLGTQCYEVTFNDYLTISGDSKLALPTENHKYRTRLVTYKGKRKFLRPLKHTTTEQLLSIPLVDKRNRKTISVPTTDPLSLPYKDLPVPPFLFGFWFFASRSTGTMLAARNTTEFVTEKFKDHGYKVTFKGLANTGEREFIITPSIYSQLIPSVPNIITNNYLLSSPEQRAELLSGIVCAKNRQYDKKSDKFRFSSQNYDTVRRIQLLVESLGGKTSINHDSSKGYYTIWFKIRIKIHPDQVYCAPKVHYGRRYVSKIDLIQPQLCVHIETTGKNNTILAGEGFIPCL